MSVEPTSTEITGTKKIAVITLVGGVILLAVVAIFVPDARTYVVDMTKTLLGAVQLFK